MKVQESEPQAFGGNADFAIKGTVGRKLQRQEFCMYQCLEPDLSNNWKPVM